MSTLIFDPSAALILTSDHAGADAKMRLADFLKANGYPHVTILGPTTSDTRANYPICAIEACDMLSKHGRGAGIFLCGSGIGISMAANRLPGIRAALCHNIETATLAREHNDANILCLGARLLDTETIHASALVFLTSPFSGGRHQERVDMLG